MAEKPEPPTVKDLMITDILTVSPEMTLDEVIARLLKRNVPAAPVVEDRDGSPELLGLVTEKDCLQYLSNEIFYGNPDVTVQSLMQRFPLCVSPDTDLFSLAAIFTAHPYRHLPVVKKKQLLGVVSRRDVLRGLHEFQKRVCDEKAYAKSLLDFREIANLRFIIK